jgi:hypothetical protein
MMVPAGRMTATARADIGARFEARPKSVGMRLRTGGGGLRYVIVLEYRSTRFTAFSVVI